MNSNHQELQAPWQEIDVSSAGKAYAKSPGRRLLEKTAAIASFVLTGLLVVSTWQKCAMLSTGSSQSAAELGDVYGAWAYTQQFVEKRLKAPSTANFPYGGSRHVTSLGNDRYAFDSYVDSQNSFGAELRTHFEGVIKEVPGGWELERLRFKD